MADKSPKRSRFNLMTLGIIIGLALGSLASAAFDIGGAGIGLGLSLGLVLGAIMQMIARSRG